VHGNANKNKRSPIVKERKLFDLKFLSFWFENKPQEKFMLPIVFGRSKFLIPKMLRYQW